MTCIVVCKKEYGFRISHSNWALPRGASKVSLEFRHTCCKEQEMGEKKNYN